MEIFLVELIVILIISLLIVIKSADIFVDNLVEVGALLGISQIILGVTASAIGTSLPEFGSAMIATLSGSVDIGVGTVIGSNIWNIAGILGITAAFTGVIKSDTKGLKRDGAVTLATALILMFFMLFGDIGKIAAIVMIIVYAIYLRSLIKAQKKDTEDNKVKIEEKSELENINEKSGSKLKSIPPKSIAWILVGFAGLVIGCRLLVYSGTGIGEILGIPEMIMGLFVLAIGTSIPELVVTFSSAMKGLHDLSIGTVLGSNTFNILIGIGVPALILNVPVDHTSLIFDAPAMIFVTVLLLLLIKKDMKLTRSNGLILLATYIAYAVIRIFVLG
ncbi:MULTISPECIES: calcium/sodium antiporter [Methanobacterium]|uniref:Cation transporter n=1 Tax=Methanobacterium bryantii TaxID=2161 RepID=A0A2A2H9V2_METBR|nr:MULTISPECIES: calcium/sodium antiporter [Methanobacterium]OEC86971.1 cation transporter [Methanobacterium sp. A39]PAV06033.1 cation transporter [Methanobacterium bryantii]